MTKRYMRLEKGALAPKEAANAKDDPIPILIPREEKDPKNWKNPFRDGFVVFTDYDSGSVTWQPVKRFDRMNPDAAELRTAKNLLAFARVMDLTRSNKQVDFALLETPFWNLVHGILPDRVDNWVRQEALNNPLNQGRMWLSAAATANLEPARVVVWCPRHGVPELAIYCPDSNAALFTKLQLDYAFSPTWRTCAGCGIRFELRDKRSDSSFHDPQCANRFRQRRYRAERRTNKQKGTKGGNR